MIKRWGETMNHAHAQNPAARGRSVRGEGRRPAHLHVKHSHLLAVGCVSLLSHTCWIYCRLDAALQLLLNTNMRFLIYFSLFFAA